MAKRIVPTKNLTAVRQASGRSPEKQANRRFLTIRSLTFDNYLPRRPEN
jgi:hypothetical protein